MKSDHFEVFSTSIGQLIKAVQFMKSRKMAEYGLKGTTALCLCQIRQSESGLTAGELSERGEIDKAQVSRAMTELTEKGFVYRNDEKGRRYKQRYCLTPRGQEVAEDISLAARRVQKRVREFVSEEEMDRFYDTLSKLCASFDVILADLNQ